MAKPAIKHAALVSAMRAEIVSGRLPPGSQLPTLDALESQFSVSRVTANRAVDELKRDGFVRSAGNQGCFVSDTPPHLYRYGIVFPPRQKDEIIRHGWRVFANQASLTRRGKELELCTYNLGESEERQLELERLSDDIACHRLAGVIFEQCSDPAVLEAVASYPVPRVVILANNVPGFRQGGLIRSMPCITLDYMSFRDRAIDCMLRRNRKRIAVIGAAKSQVQHFETHLTARGLYTRPFWLLSCSPSESESGRDLAQLLMQVAPDVRPDGIIVTDDNLLEPVCLGLDVCGLRIPQDVEVVAQANWPEPVHSSFRVTRLGFDMNQTLTLAVDCIDMQRRGQRPPYDQKLEALFEEEVRASAPSNPAAE